MTPEELDRMTNEFNEAEAWLVQPEMEAQSDWTLPEPTIDNPPPGWYQE